jgi:NAD(P)H-dependent FMN reductase
MMLKIAVIAGSTRPGRKAETVAKWVIEHGAKRGDATFELVDLASFHLPILDEAMPASMGQYAHPHTKKWAETIAKYDGFVFVTPEYNHSISGALKNALDFIYQEWNNKAAGIVGYGGQGAARAVEHLRGILGELQIADVRSAVHLSMINDFEGWTTFKPTAALEAPLKAMLDQVVSWSTALKTVRK